MGGRGYVLSWDALIALIGILLVLVGSITLPQLRSLRAGEIGFQQIHFKTEDAMETLVREGKLKRIAVLWGQDNYTNPYAGSLQGASLMAKTLIDPMIPQQAGYTLLIGNGTEEWTIYTTDWDQRPQRPYSDDAKDKTRSLRYVSGVGPDESGRGWVAKVELAGNFTREINTLRYPGPDDDDLTKVSFNLSRQHPRDTAYLVLPLSSVVTNGSMNITWETLASKNCTTP